DTVTLDGYRNLDANGEPDSTTRDIVVADTDYDLAGHVEYTRRAFEAGVTTDIDFTVDAAGRTSKAVLDPTGVARVYEVAFDTADRPSAELYYLQASPGTFERTDYTYSPT